MRETRTLLFKTLEELLHGVAEMEGTGRWSVHQIIPMHTGILVVLEANG